MSTSGSESRTGIVLELAEEFLSRYRAGERPSLKEYIDRHPSLAGEIRDVFPAMAMMEKIALVDESLDDDQTIDKPTVPIRLAPFEQLGDYRIIREVGRGGMGVVYEAEQVSLGRHVALKVLPAHALENDKQKRRFEREARAAARLHHTNIVPVFGVGEHEGVPYYVMQFIQGMGIDVVIDELKRMKAGGTNAQASFSAGGIKISRRDEAAAATAEGLDRLDDSRDSPNHPRRDFTAADLARSLVTGRFRVGESEDGETVRDLANEETVAFDPSELDAKSAAPDDASPAEEVAASAPSDSSKLFDSFIVSASGLSMPGRRQCGEARKSKAKARGKAPSFWESVATIGVQTASALEYAHTQGIQHRDVKPSNLLLDTRGAVWIADFGLAKTDDQRNITETGDLLGTLRYMPPEAFEGKVDTRGDIYALGLTLYELISFKPAFDERERGKLVKRVTTEDAPRLEKLNPAVPRDLETIVHKAIDRDPSRRYQTAGELAADLERFVADEPIAARRLSSLERLGRWRRRNPVVAGLSAALLLLMATATIGSMIAATRMAALADQQAKAAVGERVAAIDEQNAAIDAERSLREARLQGELAERERIRAEASLREAETERRRAEEGFATARSAVDDYLTKVSEDRLTQVPGLQPLRLKLLLSALAFYQDFLKERSADASIRAGLAEALLRAGSIQRELGDYESARSNCQTAIEHFERLSRDDASSVEYQHGTARCLFWLGRYDEAIAIWTKIVKPDDPRFQRDLADALNMIATSNIHPDPGRSLEAHRRALAIREMLVRLKPDDASARLGLGGSLNNLARLMNRDNRNPANALELYRRAVEHAEAAHALMPNDVDIAHNLSIGTLNLGLAYWSLGRQVEAFVSMRKAYDLSLRLAVDNPAVPSLLVGLYNIYSQLRQRYLDAGDTAAAATLTRRTRAAVERTRLRDAESLFKLASLRAACAALPAASKGKPTADETEERNRDGDLAIAALEKAIDAGFKNVDQLRKGENFAAMRDRADFQDLIKHIDSDSKNDESAKNLGIAKESLKAAKELLARRMQASAADPSNARLPADVDAIRYTVARIQMTLGKTDAAIESINEAIVADKNVLKRAPNNVDLLSNLAESELAMGELMFQAGRLADGELWCARGFDDLEAIVTRFPQSDQISHKLSDKYWTIAETQANLCLWKEAAAKVSLSITIFPGRHSQDWYSAAVILRLADDEVGLRRHLDMMIERFGHNDYNLLRALLLLPTRTDGDNIVVENCVNSLKNIKGGHQGYVVAALIELGRYDEAFNLVVDTREGGGSTLERHFHADMAIAYYRVGRKEESLRRLAEVDKDFDRIVRQALESDTSKPFGYWYQDWGWFVLSRRKAHRIVAGDVADESLLHVYNGKMRMSFGQPDRAEAEFQAAVASRPADAAGWFQRGRFFDRIGRHDRALADFNKAIELKPDDPQGLRERGRILTEMGKTDLAVADFIKAIDLARDEPTREAILDESATNPEVFARVFEKRKPTIAWCKDRLDRFGVQRRWNQAAVVAARMTDLEPENHWYWFTEAPIRLQIGDLEGYRRICREMLSRFGGTGDLAIAERTAKTCALAPDAVDDLTVVQVLADRAIQGNEASTDYGWFLIAGAMADYRLGRFDRAVERIKKIDPRADGTQIDELAFVVRAMIDQKSGHFESARAALDSARAILERKSLNAGPLFWKEWLRCKILFREAEGLILDADFPADPFLR